MTAAAPVTTAAARPRWIISRNVDLSLVIGSSLAGYVYLGLYLLLHVTPSYLWWFWSVGFDGTHVFAMAARTYFDREARRQHRGLFFGSLAFFFSLGPALVLIGWINLLIGIIAVWAYYHVIRQHYGFMVLYKVKNRDLAPIDNTLDRAFLGAMLVFPPFHRFFIHHPEDLGAPKRWALATVAPMLEPALWTLVAITAAVWIGRQIVRRREQKPVNLPKLLLFAGIFPLHWLTFAYLGWQAAVPTVTIVHNLQYHALIWFYGRNRYLVDNADSRFGRIPRTVATSLLGYAAIAVMFSALYRVPGFQLGQVSQLAFGFFAGFGLTHYYLDSRIWRVRHDPSLRQALQLA